MRLVNHRDRLHLQTPAGIVDVEQASSGAWPTDPQAIYDRWDEFRDWAAGWLVSADPRELAKPWVPADLGAPVPRPRQVFAIGLNYLAHADESGFVPPEAPVVFTKFPSSITGPVTTVELPGGHVDWEVELVAVVGRGGRDIAEKDAWVHVAGLTVGQDLSERALQHSGPAPQFSLAKSHAGFSPTGPALVTLDEFADLSDLRLGASIDGEVVQEGSTAQLIFPMPRLIAYLSGVVELLPGDLVFTGTPAGVGAGRTPPRYLQPGEVLTSWVEGIGELKQTFTYTDEVADSTDNATVVGAG